MTRRLATLALVGGLGLLGLATGCASQSEETRVEPASEQERELDGAKTEEPPEATPTAAAEDEAPVSLADFQRELAANNAKLRELGALPPVEQRDAEDGDGVEAGERRKESSGVGAAGGAPPPSAPSAGTKSGKGDRSVKKTPRRDKSSSSTKPASKAKAKDADAGLIDDAKPEAEPAKAVPLAPNDDAHNQAAVRCQQICELSAINCDLGEQICELAERHPGEEDYEAACEQANVDCELAKEACDVCVE